MFKKNDLVMINFELLDISNKSVIKIIEKFDEQFNGKHRITEIYYKNKYAEKEYVRYELDGEFVFYEKELIKINGG